MTDFGTDLATPTPFDIDPYFTFATGVDGLAQALLRRLTTPRGALALFDDDPSYGYDVRAHLNDDAPDVASIQVAIAAELVKDERVDRATAAVTFDESAESLTITADVLTAEGPFRLVLAISAVTAAVLSMESL